MAAEAEAAMAAEDLVEALAVAMPDFLASVAEDLVEVFAAAMPDFPAAIWDACRPGRLVSAQCREHTSTGTLGLTGSIAGTSSSLAATMATTTPVIRFGMATLG